MTHTHHRRAFSLLEVIVVVGIIAMFLVLIVPFVLQMRETKRGEQCASNLRRIGAGILAYAKDHENRLPGPLSTAQYPMKTAGNPVRTDQLLKYIALYLDMPANSPGGAASAKTAFTCPSWEQASRENDAPVFILNTDAVLPAAHPAWGIGEKPGLTLDELKGWKRQVAGKDESVDLTKMWALADVDQGITRILNIQEKWASGLPTKAVHLNHRNALYFDWHVEQLTLHRAYLGPSSIEELEKDQN